MSAKKDIGAASLVPDTAEIRDEMLKKYPAKVARRRAKQIVVNKVEAGGAGAGDPREYTDYSGHPHHEGLRLRGLQGRGARSHARHPSDHPRADRVRLL